MVLYNLCCYEILVTNIFVQINLLWKLSMCEWIYFVIHLELIIDLVSFAAIFVIVVYC